MNNHLHFISLAAFLFTLWCARIYSNFADFKYSKPKESYDDVVRFEQLSKNFDDIATDSGSKVIFLGTSPYQYFLNPADFDQAMSENNVDVKSYNLAFRANYGLGTYTLSTRLKMEFQKRKAKFKAVVIELAPINFNREFYRKRLFFSQVLIPVVYLNTESWAEFFKKDPVVAAELFFRDQFRVADWPYRPDFLQDTQSELRTMPTEQLAAKFGTVGLWLRPEFKENGWNHNMAGLNNWNFPESKPLYDELQHIMHKKSNWLRLVKSFQMASGIYPKAGFMGYEESLIHYYIKSVNDIKNIAEKVYLVKMPISNEMQDLMSTLADEKQLVRRILQETDVHFLDYTDSFSFNRRDFADPLHLNHEAMGLFVENLAQDIVSSDK